MFIKLEEYKFQKNLISELLCFTHIDDYTTIDMKILFPMKTPGRGRNVGILFGIYF